MLLCAIDNGTSRGGAAGHGQTGSRVGTTGATGLAPGAEQPQAKAAQRE
jgi:hypothetical protein